MAKKMTGKELVAFARSKIGTPYVYGCKGERLTKEKFEYLQKTYGKSYVWDSDRTKINKVCVDCSGLVSWGTNVMRGSAQWYEKATQRHTISTIDKAPIGALVFMKGHIGIFSGIKNEVPYYIAADGSAYGVREVPLSYNKFTHWLLDEKIFDYAQEDDEVITNETVIVNDKEYTMSIIRKDGVTYIKTRDIANALSLDVSNKGKIPVLKSKK